MSLLQVSFVPLRLASDLAIAYVASSTQADASSMQVGLSTVRNLSNIAQYMTPCTIFGTI